MTRKIINDYILPEEQCCNCTWWAQIQGAGLVGTFGICENHKSDHCYHVITCDHQQCEYK